MSDPVQIGTWNWHLPEGFVDACAGRSFFAVRRGNDSKPLPE